MIVLVGCQGCRLPSEVNPQFSTRHEILTFNTAGALLGRSPGLRGAPRDMEWMNDGRVIVACDSRGLTIYDPDQNEISGYFGPNYVNDVDVVEGQTILGMQPVFMTVWSGDAKVQFWDRQGQNLGSIPIPTGCQDVNLLPNGNLLLTQSAASRLLEMTPEGAVVWTSQVDLLNPIKTLPTERDTFLVADFDHHRVIELNRQNQILMEAKGLNHPRGMQRLPDGNLLVADSDFRRVLAIAPDGALFILADHLNRPLSVCYDPNRMLWLAGIEPFFPPLPDDLVPDTKMARLVSLALWLVGTSLMALFYLSFRIYRESWLRWGHALGRSVGAGLERFDQAILVFAVLAAVAGSYAVARHAFLLGSGWLFVSVLAAWTSRGVARRWLPDMGREMGEEPFDDLPEYPWIRSSFVIVVGISLVWLALIWSLSWPRAWWPAAAWFLGAMALVAGFTKRSQERISPADILWLAGIFVVALFFRFYRIQEIPCGLWLDEAYALWKAMQGYDHQTLSPFQTIPLIRANEFEVTNLYLMLIAMLFKTFPPSFLLLKLVSILPSLGIVWGVYCLGRWSWGAWAGRLGALMIAMNAWQVTFARWGWLQQLYVFLALLALAYWYRAYKWKCARSAALCGFFLGLGLYTYVPILITLATIGVLSLITWFETRRGQSIRLFLITAFLCALVFAPLWAFYWQNPGIFLSRAESVGLSQEIYTAHSLDPLKHNLVKYLTMFHYQGDFNPRHNIPYDPLLDPLTGGLLLVGLALALRYAYRPAERMVLLTLAAALAGGMMSMAYEAPNSFRVGLAGPMVCLLCALPLASLLHRRDLMQEDGTAPRWVAVLTALLLLCAGVLNVHRYFVRYPNPDTWNGTLGAVQHLIYEHLEPDDLGRDRLYVHPSLASTVFNVYTFFLEAQTQRSDGVLISHVRYSLADPAEHPLTLPPGRYTMVMPPDYADRLLHAYPNIQEEIINNPFGVPQVVIGRITN